MAQILVLVDAENGSVKKVTTELLTLARHLGEPVAVWVGNFEGDPMRNVSGVSGAAPAWRIGGTWSGSIFSSISSGQPGLPDGLNRA